jgi:hypothetical protein
MMVRSRARDAGGGCRLFEPARGRAEETDWTGGSAREEEARTSTLHPYCSSIRAKVADIASGAAGGGPSARGSV